MKNFKLTEFDKILLHRKRLVMRNHLVKFEPTDMTYEQNKTEKSLIVSGWLKGATLLNLHHSKL